MFLLCKCSRKDLRDCLRCDNRLLHDLISNTLSDYHKLLARDVSLNRATFHCSLHYDVNSRTSMWKYQFHVIKYQQEFPACLFNWIFFIAFSNMFSWCRWKRHKNNFLRDSKHFSKHTESFYLFKSFSSHVRVINFHETFCFCEQFSSRQNTFERSVFVKYLLAICSGGSSS